MYWYNLLMAMRILYTADKSEGFLISTQQETIERLEREIKLLRERLKETPAPFIVPERSPRLAVARTNSEEILVEQYRG